MTNAVALLGLRGDITTRCSETDELKGANTSEISLQSAFYSGSVVLRFAIVN